MTSSLPSPAPYNVAKNTTGHQNIEDIEKVGPKPRPSLTERNCCFRYLCCVCCLPVWARYILWFIIAAIIILVIIFGPLFVTFRMPAINFVGVTDTPNNRSEMYFDGNKFSINFGLLIHIQNPNVLPIRLSDMNTTAYYPDSGSGQVEIGGGFMDYENVPAHADFNFTYPFALEFEPNTGTDQTLMRTLLDKCGLTGGQPQDLTIDYTIHLTAKVLFITVHPTISSSTSFVCPLKNGGGLPGLTSGSQPFTNVGAPLSD